MLGGGGERGLSDQFSSAVVELGCLNWVRTVWAGTVCGNTIRGIEKAKFCQNSDPVCENADRALCLTSDPVHSGAGTRFGYSVRRVGQ